MPAPPTQIDTSSLDVSLDLPVSSLSLNTPQPESTSSNQYPSLSYDLIQYILALLLHSSRPIKAISTSYLQNTDSDSGSETPTPTHPIERAESNYALLAKCCLVCHEFCTAATSLLYKDVVVSPRFNPVLDLREGLSVQASSNLISAMLPHNATYVTSFEISGYISPRPGPRNPLPALIPRAIKAFINLRRVVFTPMTYHEQLFEEALPLLKTVPRLEALVVGGSSFGGERPGNWGAEEIVKVGIKGGDRVVCSGTEHEREEKRGETDMAEHSGPTQKPVLRSIGLVSPSRAILNLLPGWLEGLKRDGGTLTGLFLTKNCGSVTPGVLRAIQPHIKDKLTHFTLGISYSVTDEDAFNFLGEMQCLSFLKLKYYLQLKKPAHQPALRNLRTFIVEHPEPDTRHNVIELCKWIRRAIKGSPELEVLSLHCDDDEYESNQYVDGSWVLDQQAFNIPSPGSFDPLIDHLARKHSDKLRVLELGMGFLSVRAFKKLCDGCRFLEIIKARMGRGVLDAFVAHSANLSHLHTFGVRLVHVPGDQLDRRHEKNMAWVLQAFSDGPRSLFRIRLQGVAWEMRWAVDEVGQTMRRVEETDPRALMAPWKFR